MNSKDRLEIDINCDMGEAFGRYDLAENPAIFRYITSCNIACGFHAGDPVVMERTLQMAREANVAVGAHPSYPDLQGFGRRYMKIKSSDLKSMIKYQVAAIAGMATSIGISLSHVKPHGALYNFAADDTAESHTILEALIELGGNVPLMGLSGSAMETAANEVGYPFIREAFGDRRYNEEGRLVSRSHPDAVIESPKEVTDQVFNIIKSKRVRTLEGKTIALLAQSICVHGDHPRVLDVLKAIDDMLTLQKIQKQTWVH